MYTKFDILKFPLSCTTNVTFINKTSFLYSQIPLIHNFVLRFWQSFINTLDINKYIEGI